MSRKIKVGFRWFAMSVLAASASMIVWVAWSLTFPYEILVVNPGSWVVTNPGKHVRRGEQVLIYVDYCARRHESPRLDAAIEQEGRLMLLKPQYPAATIGCHKVTVPLVNIPRVLAMESTTSGGSGKARLQFTIRYRINAIREVQYVFTTDEFFIDP